MDTIGSAHVLPGFLLILLLHGLVGVEARSALARSQIFHPGDETDVQNKILALLLRKNVASAERHDAAGLELASRLEALKQELELQREMASERLGNRPGKSQTRRRLQVHLNIL
uniref:Uncharacterized protein n=1 Tax=Denticeps clupeoides TaxID=299321 RepID=A0A8C4C204_9TELE